MDLEDYKIEYQKKVDKDQCIASHMSHVIDYLYDKNIELKKRKKQYVDKDQYINDLLHKLNINFVPYLTKIIDNFTESLLLNYQEFENKRDIFEKV